MKHLLLLAGVVVLTAVGCWWTLVAAGCGPALPRPVAPDAVCRAQGYPHELALPDGGVAICPDDPAGFSTEPVSDFARRRRDAGVDAADLRDAR